jgi:Putative transposase of IS4/5 family (DUF4096)
MNQAAAKWVLTDSQWAEVADMLPVPNPKGGPYNNRQILEAVIWISLNKVTWAALPPQFPLYQTVYGRFRKWQAAGAIVPVMGKLGLPMPEPQRPGAKRRVQTGPVPLQDGLGGWLFQAPHRCYGPGEKQ